MRTLSRSLQRWDPMRVAAAALGLAFAVLLASYAVGAATAQPTLEGAVSAIVLLAIAASGLLYAWRPGAGGSID
jgi:hypothetical protein